MSTFPLLKTGAVAQYPAGRALEYSTSVLHFVDGREQRFREWAGATRRWVIRLELLDEGELAALEAFHAARQGRLGTFSFTDPWDGTTYPDCSLETDSFALEYQDLMRGRAKLVVRANRD
ncbi:MAG: DUF2460 domain-containing protein [Bryobacterales bacterium]|nr:DUF2460 domain-containing protein [Bryobacterales bacterium]